MKSKGNLHLLIELTIVVAVLLFMGTPSWAQSATTGALTGLVTDAKGAPVPDVTVTLTSAATAQSQTTMTGSNGLYGFSQLPPGTYEVDFSQKGFQTAVDSAVVVNESEAPALNAQLQAGSQDVRVPCQCQITQSVSAASGTLVDRKTITAVPLTTRNFTQVMSMSAGSAAGVNNASLLGTGSQSANVNGNTAAGTFTVDGAASANTVPNPDTISEFKIQTSQYDAGYGARAPNTNLLTRSGENDFHGDLWEFVRNDAFNANAFFQNATGQPKPNLKQNQFGGTIGGPIKKDKVFFFGSYQGTRQVNGLDPSSLSTMTLPPLTSNRSAAAVASEFCPGNKPANLQSRYQTFAGGKQLDCNNVATATTAPINPVALALLNMKLPNGNYVIPSPQVLLANGLGTSSFSLPSTYNEDQYVANLDYLISQKHTFSVRFYYANSDSFRQMGANLFLNSATPNVPGFPQNSPAVDYMSSIKLNSVVTSNLVNELRMTYTRTNSHGTGPNDIPTRSIGMTAVDPFLALAPDITIQGPLGGFRIGNAQNQGENWTNTYSWADNLSWVHGRHTIRTGFFALTQHSLLYDTAPARGKLVFQNFTDFLVGLSAAQLGNNGPTGSGLSSVFSIDGKEGAGPDGQILYGTVTNYFSLFLEDDIKLTPRFTLDLGLRWEYLPESSDTTMDQGTDWPSQLSLAAVPPVSGTYLGSTIPANYNPNQINPYTGQPFGPPPTGVLVRPNSSYYQNNAPLDTFAPRFGFAWQPGHQQTRLAVRGGYGWFYQTPNDNGNAPNFPLVNTQPYSQLFENTGASNGNSTLQQPFPVTTLGYVLRTATSQLTDRVLGPDYKVPLLQQWNLNIQYNLAKSLALDLGYVGSYASHLLLGFGSNQPVLASVANPVNCGLPGGCITTNTATNAALRVPFVGETPSALVASQYVGSSWYHSMQATLREQLTHGLTFQVAYTYSKSLSNTTVDNNQTNLNADWARTSFDRTHRVISNFNYDLPSLHTSGLLTKATSGWSLTGIVIVQSGLPITLMDFAGGSVYGHAGSSTATICPGANYASLVTSGSTSARLNNWINASAICPAAIVGSDGKATAYGNTGQTVMNGPGQFNTDFSVGKTTTVGGLREGAQLAFRVEFYNALNHPQFNNPGSVVGTSTFGVIQQTAVGPRLIQFGLKYLF